MSWSLVGHSSVGFADGSTGHPIAIGTPSVGDLDILTANSATTVATPAGWTLSVSHVGGQGAYVWYRIATGGEPGTVTLTTSGNFNTAATWSRWSGASAFDVAVKATVDSSFGTSIPAVSTGTLATPGELVVALAALHVWTVQPTAPVWSSGYTALDAASQATSTAGEITAFTAYRTDAGTAAESPTVSWTNGAGDRYALVVAFRPSSAPNPRDLDLVVGRPETKWRTATPQANWLTGPPRTKWRTGSPGAR